jgi:hypothetical protein
VFRPPKEGKVMKIWYNSGCYYYSIINFHSRSSFFEVIELCKFAAYIDENGTGTVDTGNGKPVLSGRMDIHPHPPFS